MLKWILRGFKSSHTMYREMMTSWQSLQPTTDRLNFLKTQTYKLSKLSDKHQQMYLLAAILYNNSLQYYMLSQNLIKPSHKKILFIMKLMLLKNSQQHRQKIIASCLQYIQQNNKQPTRYHYLRLQQKLYSQLMNIQVDDQFRVQYLMKLVKVSNTIIEEFTKNDGKIKSMQFYQEQFEGAISDSLNFIFNACHNLIQIVDSRESVQQTKELYQLIMRNQQSIQSCKQYGIQVEKMEVYYGYLRVKQFFVCEARRMLQMENAGENVAWLREILDLHWDKLQRWTINDGKNLKDVISFGYVYTTAQLANEENCDEWEMKRRAIEAVHVVAECFGENEEQRKRMIQVLKPCIEGHSNENSR